MSIVKSKPVPSGIESRHRFRFTVNAALPHAFKRLLPTRDYERIANERYRFIVLRVTRIPRSSV